MTQKEGAILSACTGIYLCKEFSVFHKYVEDLMGRPVFTHEMGSEKFTKELKELSEADFNNLMEGQS